MNGLMKGLTLAAAVMAAAGGAGAQGIARRVAQVDNGTVRMSFASRPGVCGNGRGNISTSGNRISVRRSDEWDDECEPGPVRIAMDIADRQVIALRTYVGGRWKASDAVTDLGMVGAREAVDYLLNVVSKQDGRAAQDAIFPSTIADSVVVWLRLIALAKDDARAKGVRTQAIFWVGQAAGDKATQGLVDVVDDRSGDTEVRLQAVFALSQRPRDEGVPALINIAATSKEPKIKKQAIFWLGQSHDPRALDYFEKILTAK